MKKRIRKNHNYKFILGIFAGIILSGLVVYAATSIGSSQVSYDNTKSGMSATTMQGALDELYSKVPKENKNIVAAYTYDESSCHTGEESTCKETTCYQEKDPDSCKVGDIIKYKVNNTNVVTFHVMFDKGSTLILQQHENTVDQVFWNSNGPNTNGPVTALASLESATSGWTNVNEQTYTMGTTPFADNDYTGCTASANNMSGSVTYTTNCTTYTYQLSERIARARMITVQEAAIFGCKAVGYGTTCPKWMNKSSNSPHYWTMSASSSAGSSVIAIGSGGSSNCGFTYASFNSSDYGARAVVVINK